MDNVDKWLTRIRDLLIITYLGIGLLLFMWWLNAFVIMAIGG